MEIFDVVCKLRYNLNVIYKKYDPMDVWTIVQSGYFKIDEVEMRG
jgi:hypothetical protein